MANAPKPTTPVKKESSGTSAAFATLVIPIALVVAILIYMFILGDPSHFKGGNPEGEPAEGDYFGVIHKGGQIVPVLITYLLLVFIFSIERFIVIGKASGTSSVDAFVKRIQGFLNTGNIEAAKAECDKQKGSVANVIKAGLKKYQEMEVEPNLDVDQKTLAIQKDIEEATALEMPMLEQNLTILATLVSIGTLTGLLGTVRGMIVAFASLGGGGGAGNSAQLASGISEALINTAIGILTSCLSIIMYNIFTSKIDKLTYAIDETGFSIVQTFAASHKK
ncbi:MotA/TolQ/ExbB proton channel family protein [Mucilaginibacter ginkgonis]|uniref:MotA/TolQ/ExbB proton channel family protein n=1 Tax=Mucilaginibacter ginkgonis TaxID=2682091 RepID=A0A6I4INC7_9SPHI|nr:MotA/TolQ/ExbB proton channel family protein [Mucilaginibacter ginkgonis]QQL49670.1 MotA/TolQ/ExbB proton channel family protein [Mucilaginibacter ginkgonis]